MICIFVIEGKSCKTWIELPQLRDMNDVIGVTTYLSKVINPNWAGGLNQPALFSSVHFSIRMVLEVSDFVIFPNSL